MPLRMGSSSPMLLRRTLSPLTCARINVGLRSARAGIPDCTTTVRLFAIVPSISAERSCVCGAQCRSCSPKRSAHGHECPHPAPSRPSPLNLGNIERPLTFAPTPRSRRAFASSTYFSCPPAPFLSHPPPSLPFRRVRCALRSLLELNAPI